MVDVESDIVSWEGATRRISPSRAELRLLDALGAAGLTEQDLSSISELDFDVLRDALARLSASGQVAGAPLEDARSRGHAATVWRATPEGRARLETEFGSASQRDTRVRQVLLLAVDTHDPTVRELTTKLRWLLPMWGLRRLRDVQTGWVQRELGRLAEEGLIRALDDEAGGDPVWLARPAIGDELLRLSATLDRFDAPRS